MTLIDLAARPDLREKIIAASDSAWPEFMRHDAVAARHWRHYLARFPEYTLALLGSQGDVHAAAHAIPLPWNGDVTQLPGGWDASLELGMLSPESPGPAGWALCALSIAVNPAFQAQGCGKELLLALKGLAKSKGFQSLITPMRPSHKHHHPRLPMPDYLRRKNPEGKAEDPWLRTHLSLGARVLKVPPESMRIEGTLKEWSLWTKMTFGKSGLFDLPGALAPLKVDLAKGRATYVEPNVWLQYHL